MVCEYGEKAFVEEFSLLADIWEAVDGDLFFLSLFDLNRLIATGLGMNEGPP